MNEMNEVIEKVVENEGTLQDVVEQTVEKTSNKGLAIVVAAVLAVGIGYGIYKITKKDKSENNECDEENEDVVDGDFKVVEENEEE